MMQNINDIRHHINGIVQTRQVTKAMNLIAVAKMRKSMVKFNASINYYDHIRAAIKNLLLHTADVSHPFLKYEHHNGARTGYLVIAADKGMAGGYNHNVLNMALGHIKAQTEQTYVFTVGHMARDFFNRQGFTVDVDFLHTSQDPALSDARQIAETMVELYKLDVLDQIYIVSTKMLSVRRQEPAVTRLLPVLLSDLGDVVLEPGVPASSNNEILHEPSPQVVFNLLIPQYLVGVIYSLLVESSACEHCARMNAMDSATRNADEMIGKLQIAYNVARQADITQEMSEIISGADAIED